MSIPKPTPVTWSFAPPDDVAVFGETETRAGVKV